MESGMQLSGSAMSVPIGGSEPHVQQVVQAAHDELRDLLRQRADIMKRIGTVIVTVSVPTRTVQPAPGADVST